MTKVVVIWSEPQVWQLSCAMHTVHGEVGLGHKGWDESQANGDWIFPDVCRPALALSCNGTLSLFSLDESQANSDRIFPDVSRPALALPCNGNLSVFSPLFVQKLEKETSSLETRHAVAKSDFLNAEEARADLGRARADQEVKSARSRLTRV